MLGINSPRPARVGAVVAVQLMCGCSSGLWNYLMSYVVKDGDSVELLSSRFGVSMDSIESVNGLNNPDNITIGALYYIPLNASKFKISLLYCHFIYIYILPTLEHLHRNYIIEDDVCYS